MSPRLLTLERWTHFFTASGECRELVDPHEPATPRQLRRLNAAGCLIVVQPGDGRTLTKGEAAHAVAIVTADEREKAGERRRSGQHSEWRAV